MSIWKSESQRLAKSANANCKAAYLNAQDQIEAYINTSLDTEIGQVETEWFSKIDLSKERIPSEVSSSVSKFLTCGRADEVGTKGVEGEIIKAVFDWAVGEAISQRKASAKALREKIKTLLWEEWDSAQTIESPAYNQQKLAQIEQIFNGLIVGGGRYMEHDCKNLSSSSDNAELDQILLPYFYYLSEKKLPFKIQDCSYQQVLKGRAIMLNVDANQLARWTVNACQPNVTDNCLNGVIHNIWLSNNAQFPITGTVTEPASICGQGDGEALFAFRDGVTVALKSFRPANDGATCTKSQLTPSQLETALVEPAVRNGKLLRIANVVGTGSNVASYLSNARNSYLEALGVDEYKLLKLWAIENRHTSQFSRLKNIPLGEINKKCWYATKSADIKKYCSTINGATQKTDATSIDAVQDYAAWAKKNTDGSWTAAAEAAVASSNLPGAVPKDIDKFCPGYKVQDVSNRKFFWVGLLSIVARPESNFKPETKYTEKFKDSNGKNVISRGLLQISIESANQKRYSCGIKRAEDLHDPAINLTCGIKILDAWMMNDNVIATYGNEPSRGGGRYWSTLREKNKHLPELTAFTRALKVCSST